MIKRRRKSNKVIAAFLVATSLSSLTVWQSFRTVHLPIFILGPPVDAPAIPKVRTLHAVEPYPRWEEETGLTLQPLLRFLRGVLAGNATIRFGRADSNFSETPYVVDERGIWTSHTIRQRNAPVFRSSRLKPIEKVMVVAHKLLLSNSGSNSSSLHKWERLREVVQTSGFVFVVFYGDFKLCNQRIYKRTESLPIFTMCAHVNCSHAFPIPTYKTISGSREIPEDWNIAFERNELSYPWENKTRKIGWRGALTGPLMNYTSPRARLAIFGAEHRSGTLFDIGVTNLIARNHKEKVNITRVGGLVPYIRPMHQFQQFVGILDTDGNSWSSRFGELLCYNSVILKVEPQFVDYFHPSLKPWKHFVPVKYDLSDLEAKAQYVVDPANADVVRSIIQYANNWCRHRMLISSIAHDILDVWSAYVGYLDKGDANWSETWKVTKSSYLAADFDLVKVPVDCDPRRTKSACIPYHQPSENGSQLR